MSLGSWALVFVVAVAVRAAHLWQIRNTPFFDVLMGDAKAYDLWGQRIAKGDWIGTDVFYQAPLYPYFLGAIYWCFGRSLLLVRAIQAFMGAGAAVLLGLAGQRLFSPRAGLIAGVAMALYAPSVFFDSLLQKAVMDEWLICVMLWIVAGLIARPHRPRAWLGLGLATGALSLTRENALVFVAVLLLWAVSTVRRSHSRPNPAAAPACFVLGLALVLLPVVIRNNVVSGGFYLTTSQFGANFFMGNNERADGTAMSLRPGRGSPEYERQDATDLAEQALGRKLTPGEVSSYWTDRALRFARTQPLAWLGLQGRKFVLLWNATEIPDTESQESYAEDSLPLRIGGLFGNFGILVPLALFGLLLVWPGRGRIWPVLAMFAAYAASVVMFYIYARYRYPLVPMLLLFAGVGLAALPGFVRSFVRADAAHPSRFGILAVVVAAGVFTNLPLISADMSRTLTEHNLGAALQDESRFDEAILHYRRALAITPGYASAQANIGTVLQAQGHLDEAIAAYERALSMGPALPEVHYNLGNALLAKNEPAKAEEQFRIAVPAMPGSADVHNNLGSALESQGKLADAIAEFETAVKFDPSSSKAERNLGNVLASAGRPAEGLTHLRKATELDPRDAASHYDLGSLLLEGKRIPEAIAAFRAALAVDPGMADAHNNLGIALGSAGNLDEAVAEFQQALRLQPNLEDAQRNLAMTLQALRQLHR